MPSKSAPQARLMAMKCHDPSKSKGGPSQKVACEFNRADKGTGILTKGAPTKKRGKK